MKKIPESKQPENIQKVMNMFLNCHENTYPAISKKTGLTEGVVKKIIDHYFDDKMKKNRNI